MALLKTLARIAAQRLANDPEMQQRLIKAVKEEVVPRAQKGWKRAQPEMKKAKNKVDDIAETIKEKINK